MSDLLLAYYGDDFTGSTDVMEALSLAGLRTVLFLKPPTPEQLAKFPGLRAFGIAGGSRTMSPEEMERELPPAFEALKASGAPIIHYKICSTFDSSPSIGSIGRAIEIGRRVFGERPTPLMVGAPALGRYVAFGNLFARSGLDTEPFRLDRHPTMSRHPVTPMKEADIRLILGEQTTLPVELVDVLKMENVGGQWSEASGQSRPPIVLFDTLRDAHLPLIGKAIEVMATGGQLFVVGSSGVEYALTSQWKQSGLMGNAEEGGRGENVSQETPCPSSSAVEQIIAVSGSCSPVTDRQIGLAVASGFVEVACDTSMLANIKSGLAGANEAVKKAERALNEEQCVIFHTARGPEDGRSKQFDRVANSYGGDSMTAKRRVAGEELARSLAKLLSKALEIAPKARTVVCGGDTSMHVARALGVEALEYLGPMAPGSPLCKVHAPGRIADGCEIVFKGGQVGRDRFFLDVLNGGPAETDH